MNAGELLALNLCFVPSEVRNHDLRLPLEGGETEIGIARATALAVEIGGKGTGEGGGALAVSPWKLFCASALLGTRILSCEEKE